MLNISMGPCPTAPVDLPFVPVSVPVPPSPTQRPSTWSHISVGVLPSGIQDVPRQTFASRGVSPNPFPIIDLLPASLTESEPENEGPSSRFIPQVCTSSQKRVLEA